MNETVLYSNATDTAEPVVACGIYAHGELERLLGYDVICPRFRDFGESFELIDLKIAGLHDVIIQHHDQRIPAKLFYWEADNWHRGLAVLEGDKEAYDYAKVQFDKRSRML